MNGFVVSSYDTVVPTVAANAMSSTTTRPGTLSGLGNTRGDANTSSGRCMRSLRTIHRRAPAVVQVDLPDGASVTTLRPTGEQQAQRALTAVRDERAAPPGC